MWQTHKISEEILQQSLKQDTNNKLTASGFLRNYLHISARNTQKLFRSHGVLVNRRPTHSNKLLTIGDIVKIRVLEDKITLSPDFTPLSILYEDDYTLVVNKPPFLVVHPTEKTLQGTLSNRVAGYYKQHHLDYAVRPIHRLDRDTSGCLLFAKTREAQQYYTTALHDNSISRIYTTIVEGCFSDNELTKTQVIDKPIGIDPNSNNRRCVNAQGKESKTFFKVLKTNHTDKNSWLEVTIPTGRTHQIRVHMAYIGHAVCGDAMYGKKGNYTRQCLHASKLIFIPYQKNKALTIEAPIPKKFGQEMK